MSRWEGGRCRNAIGQKGCLAPFPAHSSSSLQPQIFSLFGAKLLKKSQSDAVSQKKVVTLPQIYTRNRIQQGNKNLIIHY